MLSVLFDATAVPADRGGVGRYVDNLLPALADLDVELTVVCRPGDVTHYSALAGRPALAAPSRTTRRPARLTWEQTGLAWLARRPRFDVLHSPHYTYPWALTAPRGALAAVRRGASPMPVAVTLHDATFFTEPALHGRDKGPFFRFATRRALRYAAICLVPSQATADELAQHAGVAADRTSPLVVAHHGVDHEVFAPPSPAAVEQVRATLGLRPDEPYIAFLGTLEPRKNLPALVRGWVRASAGRSRPPALVLAGGSGWEGALDAAVAAVPSGLRVIRPGYLPLVQLPGLLGGATVVAYPSLGEGFGLPVLEAMACGAAVLTTRRLALPEVGGDAVAYTGVDSAAIGTALAELLDDPARRAELGAAARQRAAGFSWRACAEQHLRAYHDAIRAVSR
ncbi:MAG: glycosyl transferase, group 1 [Frankiales bacterium]|nr:glycosyl transferase, group 1 [Frankiales bacterium]